MFFFKTILVRFNDLAMMHFVLSPAATAAVEGKMSKTLKKMMKKLVVKEAQEQLLVADAKLGNSIKVSHIPTSFIHIHIRIVYISCCQI